MKELVESHKYLVVGGLGENASNSNSAENEKTQFENDLHFVIIGVLVGVLMLSTANLIMLR